MRGVIYLARQNIAYRGHREHIKLGRPGNFQAMLDLLAENRNDALGRHFETSPQNATGPKLYRMRWSMWEVHK